MVYNKSCTNSPDRDDDWGFRHSIRYQYDKDHFDLNTNDAGFLHKKVKNAAKNAVKNLAKF